MEEEDKCGYVDKKVRKIPVIRYAHSSIIYPLLFIYLIL